MVRVDAAWNVSDRVRWIYGGGVGTQSVETLGGDDQRTSSDAYLGFTWQVSDSWALRARATHQDVAAAFDRSRLRVVLVRTF